MKKILLTALLGGTLVLSSYAQGKLDARAAMLSGMVQAAASRSGSDEKALGENIDFQVPQAVLVEIKDMSVADQLANLGAEVLNVRANIALVVAPVTALEQIAALDGVVSVSMGYENRPMLDVARVTTGVADIQAGTGLPQAYTGQGVICGLMDTGLDPNHINFKDADGNLRIKRLWNITGNNSAVATYDTPEAIARFTTDQSAQTHGTHVLGIIAGSYKGKLQQYFINDKGNQQNSTTRNNRYYGVATDAELAVNCGTLDGNNILVAAENLLKYAKEQKKPAVMNLSLGHNTGPHDGTTNADKYLADVGKEMIICISAGNEGADAVSVTKAMTASDKIVRTCAGSSSAVTSVVDVWNSDSTPLKVTFAAVDKTNGSVKYQYTLEKTIETTSDQVIITGNYYNRPEYVHDQDFNDAFGEMGAVFFTKAGVNSANKRYNVTISIQTNAGKNNSIVPAVFVEGSAGNTVHLYTNKGFTANGISGYVSGDASMSINDMACGENVLSVGAYVNRETWPCQGGPLTYRGTTQGEIASFSSYGVVNGKTLPEIAGPGQVIISSYSNYYVAANNTENLTATYTESKRKSYWAEMSGTSMSSPFVAGVMALWLQADPTLTISEVKEILKETAVKDTQTAAAPNRFGFGKIDALAGLKKIIASVAVKDVVAESEILISETGRGTYDIFAPGAKNITAVLYSINGAQAALVTEAGENATISAEGLASGIYILRVNADGKTQTRKLAL